ncbi:hypothetical protein D7B24_004518, partial [Verticillium nonalfalfae]
QHSNLHIRAISLLEIHFLYNLLNIHWLFLFITLRNICVCAAKPEIFDTQELSKVMTTEQEKQKSPPPPNPPPSPPPSEGDADSNLDDIMKEGEREDETK